MGRGTPSLAKQCDGVSGDDAADDVDPHDGSATPVADGIRTYPPPKKQPPVALWKGLLFSARLTHGVCDPINQPFNASQVCCLSGHLKPDRYTY